MALDPTYPLVPIANFLACILTLLPLSTSFRQSSNTGVIMYAIWVAIQSFTTAVNSIIWSDNTRNIAPVWCDITTHLGIASNAALPACSLVITRRLYKISRMQGILDSKRERHIALTVDLILCLLLPLIVMGPLYYVVQGGRFAIFEQYGCTTTQDASGLSMILIDSWGVTLPAISIMFYCPRIIWIFYRQRKDINEFLSSSKSIGRSNYFRIIALGCFDALITLPFGIVTFVSDAANSSSFAPFVFYQGWTFIHTDWFFIPQIPSEKWLGKPWADFSVRFNEWINILLAIIYFVLFGLTSEARATYRHAFWSVGSIFGFTRPTQLVQPEMSDLVYGSVHVKFPGTDSSNDPVSETGHSGVIATGMNDSPV